jgi:dephospho-CoA kinase
LGKAVLITGVAGSGKSTVCKRLEELGYRALDIELVEGMYQMVDAIPGKAVNYENTNLTHVQGHRWICNKERLEQLLRDNSNADIVFCCGSASNLGEILPIFDQIFLLEVSDETLTKRLSERGGGEFGRTPEIREQLLHWKAGYEERVRRWGATSIDTERGVDATVRQVLKLAIFENC